MPAPKIVSRGLKITRAAVQGLVPSALVLEDLLEGFVPAAVPGNIDLGQPGLIDGYNNGFPADFPNQFNSMKLSIFRSGRVTPTQHESLKMKSNQWHCPLPINLNKRHGHSSFPAKSFRASTVIALHHEYTEWAILYMAIKKLWLN